ncbi:hypothetical protein L6164_034183 [Bauhinia variegata]|uniref:Uncharacterized protein n=1 Tax=Bauhinia variegata TaxID=167791 RepID=A0ACB9KUW0_BAUVA|nr:hypothetical protein L6164_034183 [Bauhinia variegata]
MPASPYRYLYPIPDPKINKIDRFVFLGGVDYFRISSGICVFFAFGTFRGNLSLSCQYSSECWDFEV